MEISLLLKALFGDREFSIMDQSILDYYKKYAENLIVMLNTSKFIEDKWINKFQFEFRYLPFYKINGESDNYNGVDIIGINEGVIDRSCELAYKIVSFFPDLRNFEFIRERFLGIKNSLCVEENLYNIIYYVPCKDEDKIISEFMAMFAIKFVILHEIGHLYNGHVEYLKKKLGVEKLSDYKGEHSIPDLDYRTIEMDADAFAISMLVNEIICDSEKYKELKKVLNDENEIYKILAYGINIVFLLMEKDYGRNYNNRYLPLMDRRILALDCIITNKSIIKGSINDESIRAIIYESFINVQNCFYTLESESKENIEKFKDNILNHDHNGIDEVNKRWQFIRNELKNYTRLGLSMW